MDPNAPIQATLEAMAARLAELEAAHSRQRVEHDRQQERIAALEGENERLRRPAAWFGRRRADAAPATSAAGPAAAPASARTSRRGMLGTAAKVAVATAAAGVLVEQVGTRTAHASGPGSFDSNVSGTPAVSATGTNGADGVDASSDTGSGVSGTATGANAVGVNGVSTIWHGVMGATDGGTASGVYGGNYGNSANGIGVTGHSDLGNGALGPGIGVLGETATGTGVQGTAGSGGTGVAGIVSGTGQAVYANADMGYGVYATSVSGVGVFGTSNGGAGTQAMYASGSNSTAGLRATSDSGNGIVATSTSGTGLNVQSSTGSAVVATSNGVGYGLYLTAPSGWAIGCVGRVRVLGAAVGTVTLTHGTTTKTVSTSACSSSSQVILTPTSNPQVSIWAVAAPGAFTIHASTAPSSDVTFSYFLIN